MTHQDIIAALAAVIVIGIVILVIFTIVWAEEHVKLKEKVDRLESDISNHASINRQLHIRFHDYEIRTAENTKALFEYLGVELCQLPSKLKLRKIEDRVPAPTCAVGSSVLHGGRLSSKR